MRRERVVSQFQCNGGIMSTICEMCGVREHTEGYPVQFARNDKTGRLVIIASNECGNNVTEIDLFDLIEWLKLGPSGETHGHDSQ
jgi:hypothetical protein